RLRRGARQRGLGAGAGEADRERGAGQRPGQPACQPPRAHQANSLAQRRFSLPFQPPRCHASETISGTAVVASANTICSSVVCTLPQEAASFSVEDEQAPSLTSATVICTAYLCISASWPRISAHTTVSWAKFLGTPPPTMKRPVVPAASLTSVSSRKSATASMVM